MCPTMPREGMILTWIAVYCRVWFLGKRRLDRSLRRLGNELVLLGQVHQQRRMKPVDFAQIFLRVTTVIGDRGGNAFAHGCQKDHQGAEAVAEDGDPTGAPRQLGHSVNGVLNVLNAAVTVIGLIETEAVLPVGLRCDVTEVDARLLPPE